MKPTMLARYSIVRGVPASALPRGIRQDTRRHTHHVLRPTAELVDAFLVDTADEARWQAFRTGYRALVEARFAEDRAPFDALAELARREDVYLGCNCPTAKNPDVRRCHTSLALAFMKERYPDLEVRMPDEGAPRLSAGTRASSRGPASARSTGSLRRSGRARSRRTRRPRRG